ncbi:MAG: hypothetical protein ACYC7F_00665 [Gemmatimonadaceae bacterium]
MARPSVSEQHHSDLVPDIFDTGTERLPSSGQFSAATISGVLLAAAEALVAPLIFAYTLVASVFFWWLLDAPWAGRRRRSSRAQRKWYLPAPRVIYLGTLMLIGLWLSTMFVFRASDPAVTPGFAATLPNILGVDVSVLQRMNGMQSPINGGPEFASSAVESSIAPFSLFAHGTASTIAVALLAYAFQSARRRIRRARRARSHEDSRSHRPSAAH